MSKTLRCIPSGIISRCNLTWRQMRRFSLYGKLELPYASRATLPLSYVMSVRAETMTREVPFHTPSCVFLLFCATIVLSIKCVDSLPDRCLEVVSLDIDEIEDYLTKINLVDVPTVKMMAAGFKCPISALPFGALKSDWSRLLLLQEAQPDSIIKRKLVRLMRFLIVAYYQMEESFDVIKPDMQILQALIKERMATSLAASKSRNLSANQSWTTESLGAVEAAAENATSTAPGNCLRQSLKDILSRKPPNRTRYPVFERLQNKKHGGRAPQRRNEINGCAKNADVPAKISPLANDFWRYAQFPTGVPLTISTIARPYRVQGLNGFRMNPRKSRKRAGLNSDGHTKATEVLRRLTKIKKNKEVR
ncbi:uncharacterized protein LOC116850406 isoform X3 [Odontomachus brunneus]|uniref:uncharacterized protein LOC116850406 isoform X3 n=1 Tax=Odontomachus brunneus TaxID=486640 RepID=UPI0013F1F4E3|nr:uncharacterized protein LOC116850406 isoform X3 [Odontomachus brunneus]